ncbi:MAG: GDP-mannose 4,6-dehydratase [Candidatus Eremiobacteraeota bacterium]|nr:GDP-mannose 4,6-dehydratase [Candidatus Eremiobacteraeota bacterium]
METQTGQPSLPSPILHDHKTLLLTGAAGFIGSNFARYLFDRYPQYRIVVYDALTYAGNLENIPKYIRDSERFEFIYGNVCNGAQVMAAMTDANIVVHFAAETHVTRSIYDAADFVQTDVIGTANMVSAALSARSLERFIHVSTSEVYGSCLGDVDMMDEKHPLEPCSPYASAKTGADRIVYSYWRTYNLPAVIVRPFNNYGPRQHLEKCIPRFITSALRDEPLTVHGDGRSSRDWVHVDDTCAALDLLLHAPLENVVGEVFNVASGIDTSVATIAEMVLSLTGKPRTLLTSIGQRPGQVDKHKGDASKIRKVLGWKPQIAFLQGLGQTLEWYAQNEDFWERMLWMRRIKIRTKTGTEFH